MEKEMKKKVGISIIAIVAIVTTIKLAVIYYNANFNPYALASFCSINDFIDCDGIAKTTESQFLGVPLAYWGLFFYSFVFLMFMLLFFSFAFLNSSLHSKFFLTYYYVISSFAIFHYFHYSSKYAHFLHFCFQVLLLIVKTKI